MCTATGTQERHSMRLCNLIIIKMDEQRELIQERAKQRERRTLIASQLFLIKRVDLVLKFCVVFVLEFLLVFGFIVTI